MLKILMRKIEWKADSYIGDTQFGFRKGKGTRDATMRMLCERSLKLDNDDLLILKKILIRRTG